MTPSSRLSRGRSLSRRASLALATATFAGSSILQQNAAAQDESTKEATSGDPDLPLEVLSYNQTAINSLVMAPFNEANYGFKPPTQTGSPGFAENLVRIAGDYADRGVNRAGHPDEVKAFLRLFLSDPVNPATGKVWPFCAAGLSWAACAAYLRTEPVSFDDAGAFDSGVLAEFRTTLPALRQYYFRPHCAVQEMRADARSRNTYMSRESFEALDPRRVKEGWLVVYNWNPAADNIADHIGLLVARTDGGISTVEFNTSRGQGDQRDGGVVARRTRNTANVDGIIAWY